MALFVCVVENAQVALILDGSTTQTEVFKGMHRHSVITSTSCKYCAILQVRGVLFCDSGCA